MSHPDSDDDDVPQLSADTLAILQEFLQEKMAQLEVQAVDEETVDGDLKEELFEKDLTANFPEDWVNTVFYSYCCVFSVATVCDNSDNHFLKQHRMACK